MLSCVGAPIQLWRGVACGLPAQSTGTDVTDVSFINDGGGTDLADLIIRGAEVPVVDVNGDERVLVVVAEAFDRQLLWFPCWIQVFLHLRPRTSVTRQSDLNLMAFVESLQK